jgi:tRNA 2-selenouridine synthase SelU
MSRTLVNEVLVVPSLLSPQIKGGDRHTKSVMCNALTQQISEAKIIVCGWKCEIFYVDRTGLHR